MKSFLIGRGLECDVVLTDPSVSRRHAEFVVKSEREFLLRDSESTYGTFVGIGQDWKQITVAPVAIDDRIRFGRYTTTVRAIMSAMIEKLRASAPAEPKQPLKAMAAPLPKEPANEPAKRPAIERDPETGEIIKRK